MSSPTVTVLMSVFNGGEYLSAAVKSVLTQTFDDFEFLIINDCSRDDSVKIIESFRDPRIRLINNETNLGQTRSLNKGLSLARGRYIARMDADDIAFPEWLAKTLKFLQEQPLIVVASCKAVVINSAGEIKRSLNTPANYEEMVLRSLFATPINHVGAIYKTDVITSFGGYDEFFKIAADYELWSKLIRSKIRLASTQETLVAVRIHEKSISMKERGRLDSHEIMEIMARNFKSLVSFHVARGQIHLLWKLNYAPELLNLEEFRAVLVLLENAYQNIDGEFKINQSVITNFLSRQVKVFYAKRAFTEIEKGNLDKLRALSRDYRRSKGWLNMFSLLWLGSWFGTGVLRKAPLIYHRWQAWQTQKKAINVESFSS